MIVARPVTSMIIPECSWLPPAGESGGDQAQGGAVQASILEGAVCRHPVLSTAVGELSQALSHPCWEYQAADAIYPAARLPLVCLCGCGGRSSLG